MKEFTHKLFILHKAWILSHKISVLWMLWFERLNGFNRRHHTAHHMRVVFDKQHWRSHYCCQNLFSGIPFIETRIYNSIYFISWNQAKVSNGPHRRCLFFRFSASHHILISLKMRGTNSFCIKHKHRIIKPIYETVWLQ